MLDIHLSWDKNMSEFIAIPVSAGDAFYLKRNDYSILVDGGINPVLLPSLFKTTTKTNKVNILVCTHNDADHANGILGYLKAGLFCDEVWLPGSWLNVLPDILKPLDEVYADLVRSILDDRRQQEIDGTHSVISSLETYHKGNMNLLAEKGKKSKESALDEDGWTAMLIDLLKTSVPWDATLRLNLFFKLGWPPDFFSLRRAESRLLWSAIKAASRIRAIAQEASRRCIPVRWFEYDTNSPSGGNHYLKPLNAKELTSIRPHVGSLLYLLSLSVANKESLVFWAPPTDQYRGVLFNADSDLANVMLPANNDLLGALATAPHHGAQTNASAYTEVTKAAPSAHCTMIWIRSDCKSNRRPGASYLSLGCSMRTCTICHLSHRKFTKKLAVVLRTIAGSWQLQSTICMCK
jgi:hypothetical protein